MKGLRDLHYLQFSGASRHDSLGAYAVLADRGPDRPKGPACTMRVLLVEDNKALAANICDFLTLQGFSVDFADNGPAGLHLAVTESFDVVVLDIGLPGLDGLEVCRMLREEGGSDLPVLMLTARDTLDDKLDGFASGADDYLIKPFALRELEARIRVLGRRGAARAELRVGDLVFDVPRLAVRRAGRRIDLPPICLRLLEALMRAHGRVLRREELEQVAWGDDPPLSDSLRTHIHTIRAAIDKPFDRPLLHTVRGTGWSLDDAHDLPA